MARQQTNKVPFTSVVMAIVLLGMIVWFLRAVWIVFADIVSKNGVVAAAIVAFFGTVMAATITVVWGRYLERRKEVEVAHRQKQMEVFDQYVVMFYDYLLNPEKMSEQPQEFVGALKAFAPKLTLWGKAESIKAFGDFRTFPEDGSAVERLHMFERFMLMLRKDLGHKDKELKQGDLLRIIINDYDVYMRGKQG